MFNMGNFQLIILGNIQLILTFIETERIYDIAKNEAYVSVDHD